MKVDFSRPICNLEGQQFKNQDGKPITLGTLAAEALLQMNPHDSGEQRANDGWLAERCYASKEIDISLEEAARIKKRIGEALDPLMVSRAWSMLDPKPSAKVA